MKSNWIVVFGYMEVRKEELFTGGGIDIFGFEL